MVIEKDIKIDSLVYFRFKRLKHNRVLMTNDAGNYIFVSLQEFDMVVKDSYETDPKLFTKLKENNFISTHDTVDRLAVKYNEKNWFLNYGPSLFAMVGTLRCDHSCNYCQVSRVKMSAGEKYDTPLENVEKIVDILLETTAPSACIEFQGGEPLANFPYVKKVIETANEKNEIKKKEGKGIDLIFSVVTNTTFLDDEKLKYLLDQDVSICTSLDGPEDIHNKHRRGEINTYASTVKWINKINAENKKRSGDNHKYNKVNAIPTLTKDGLKRYKDIIDLYLELGLPSIQLRPLQPFGFGKGSKSFTYSADDYIEFYQNSMDYILEINRNGTPFFEKISQAYLKKILYQVDPNYLDLRAPGGFGIGSMGFYYNGGISTCDEGRMVHEMGDDEFIIGDVNKSSYKDVIASPTVRRLAIASTLEGIPGCNDCAYNPYCSVSPVYNYVLQGSLFGQTPTSYRHKVAEGTLDYLFETLEENHEIYQSWLELN